MGVPGGDVLAVFAALAAAGVVGFAIVSYRRLAREARGLPPVVKGKPWRELTWEEKMAFAARKRAWEIFLVTVSALAFVAGVVWSYVEWMSGTISWQESLLVSSAVVTVIALCVLGSELVWRR
ncbi:MAG: hypothetical protein H5U04_04830 [Firmicutes bacterium]|nr:hypothetical protein [Bacillota bacterium]